MSDVMSKLHAGNFCGCDQRHQDENLMNTKLMVKRLFALPLILLAALSVVFMFSESAKSGGSMPAGSWSSGDRQDGDIRLSLGWKKMPALPSKPGKGWSPALASTTLKTGVLWSLAGTNQLAGYLWEEASGTWTSDSSFFPPPVPVSPVSSAPALIHRGSGLLDLIVLGKDQYYHAYYTGGKWSAWEPIGGMGGSPAITASKTGPTKIDVWVVAMGSIWRQRWQQATGWQGWKEIGFPAGVHLTAAPGAVVRSDNTIDIVAPAQSNGQLWHASFSPADVFSGWEKIPGKTFTQPSLTSDSPENLEVWVKGASDGFIYHETWAGGQWQDFDKSINQVLDPAIFISGPAADRTPGITTVAGVNDQDEVLVRSWAADFPSKEAAKPATILNRRPVISAGKFVAEDSAENTITIAPKCNATYLSLGKGGDVQKQTMDCVLKGTGEKSDGGYKACDSQKSINKKLGSTDNQMAVLKNGTVLLLRQGGGINSVTTRTNNDGSCRGIETIYYSSSCGGPFDASFCNNDENTIPKGPPTDKCSNLTINDRTGTDRPEILASRVDGSVFIALGVAGAKKKHNLVLLRSDESNLSGWKVMDTGLPSGGASSLAEGASHLYLARCEYGSPANVGLYAYRKDKPFVAKNFVFLGNIADATCSNGDVNISLMRHNAGFPIIRWVIPYVVGGQSFFKRGFSAVTPGGLAKINSIDYQPSQVTRTSLPTLVASDFEGNALLYWYELSKTDNRWRMKASVSDGIGRWSPAFNLTDAWWEATGSPWTGVPSDYMKGYPLKLDGKMKFLAQWIQPVAGNNEIFYGIVDY
jgi:hypothetical protein